jgi:hypothetical protein
MKRLFVLLVALAGCSSTNKIVSLDPPERPPAAKDYVDQVKRWSRHGDLRSDFDATMIVDATFHSPEFHSAYVAKYLDVYKVPPDSRAKVAATIPQAPDQYELHVETQTHTWEVNELHGPKSIWRVTLLDDRGREAQSTEIKLETTRPEYLQTFYPYTAIFSRPWRVLFPRVANDGTPLVGPDTKSITLRIAGPAGAIDLVWKLKP